MTAAHPKHKPLWLLYLVVSGAILALMVSGTRAIIQNAPNRDAVADLGSYGLVTVRFSTNPDPPLPTGVVGLSFMTMNTTRQRPVTLDSLRFEYGRKGDDRPVGSGQGEPMSDSSGMAIFMGNARFPDVGDWWMRVRLSKGGEQAEVRFTFYVKPAQ